MEGIQIGVRGRRRLGNEGEARQTPNHVSAENQRQRTGTVVQSLYLKSGYEFSKLTEATKLQIQESVHI